MLADRMDAFVVCIGAAVMGALGVIIAALLSTIGGLIVGAIVGLFFEQTILGIAAQLGVKDVSMWQLGAFLGFVGGFLRPAASWKAA